MMATIIQVSETRFIAGDPDTTLHAGNHWCSVCGGDGLSYEYDWITEEQELAVCYFCSGSGQVECEDGPDCAEHRGGS